MAEPDDDSGEPADAEAADGEPAEAELAARLEGARPAGDSVGRAVWFARVATALFGSAAPVHVGRYEIRRTLGRGGGGAVYAAWDPELRRDVAVKLIECPSAGHRARALAEAQALARLSHPNVVAVHDVGAQREHVYLVMELLGGGSLRDLANDPARSRRQLITAYREAALGLAAAHAAHLVHRDFKPDNALLGDDGRLRVVDFGLAIDPDQVAPRAGTPRYMAPEQRSGEAITTAADQYALAIALREALAARGRVPAWIDRVLARATATEPAARYPSIVALADALNADPRRRWQRRALMFAPIAMIVVGVALGRGVLSDSETCTGGEAMLASAWTRPRAIAAASRIAGLGTPFAIAVAPTVHERAAQLGEGWLAAYHQSCRQHDRRELSGALYDRAAACLARSRAELGEAMRVLETATSEQLPSTIQALTAVEPATRCTDAAALVGDDQATLATLVIEEQIAAARVLVRAATSDARQRSRAVVAAARASGEPSLIARALLVEGHAEMDRDLSRAVAPLHEAMQLALRHQLDDVAVEAYARYLYARARTTEEPPRPDDGIEIAASLAERAGARAELGHALLYNNAGTLALAAGDRARAHRAFARALELANDVTGAGAVELLVARANLALVTPDAVERARLYADAGDRARRLLGADHPLTLYAELAAALDRAEPREVVAQLGARCARLAALHPTLVDRVTSCAFELAWQAFAVGDLATVRAAAAWPSGPGGRALWSTLLRSYAGLAGVGAMPTVAELAALARSETAKLSHGGWARYVYAADAELALASAAQRAGDRTLTAQAATRATAHLEQAIAAQHGQRSGALTRRLERARSFATR